jgi:hypothetical protein
MKPFFNTEKDKDSFIKGEFIQVINEYKKEKTRMNKIKISLFAKQYNISYGEYKHVFDDDTEDK